MRVETYIEAHTAAAVEAARANSMLALMRLYRLPEKMITPVAVYAGRKSRQAHKFALKYGDELRLLRSWAEDWGSP
jgi:hypothetical protein